MEMRAEGYWKLTEEDLDRLVELKLISSAKRNDIINASKARHPGRFANEIEMEWLNNAKTIRLQSIHFYGGENFGNPHHWVAEIVAFTTCSALRSFLNKYKLRLPHSFY